MVCSVAGAAAMGRAGGGEQGQVGRQATKRWLVLNADRSEFCSCDHRGAATTGISKTSHRFLCSGSIITLVAECIDIKNYL